MRAKGALAETAGVDIAVFLDEESDHDPALLGGKGASLARLVSRNVPVPDTAVVTTAAYDCIAAAGLIPATLDRIRRGDPPSDADIVSLFHAADLPLDVADEIVNTARAIGDSGPIAVRSSATVEDLDGASFAGQYSSFLGVDSGDPAAVMRAVRAVWASLWLAAPVAYRDAFEMDDDEIAMAVVLMPMINAERAGVVFTAEPGGTGAARIEAVEGLGDSLVSGDRTPTAWLVDRDDGHTLPEPARSALRLSLEIEATEGVPQDVEWASIGNDVWIVQARPITTTDHGDGLDSPLDEHLLTTAGIGEMVPGVVSPLLWDINRFLLEEAYRSMFGGLGILHASADQALIRRVRGRIAVDFDRLRDIATDVPGAVRDLELEYFGASESDPDEDGDASAGPAFARRPRQLLRQLRSLRSRHHAIGQADIVIQTVELLWPRRPDLSSHTNAALLSYSARLTDLAARGLAAELAVAAAGAASFERLEQQLHRHLGPTAAPVRAQELIAGVGFERVHDRDASAAIFGGPTWNDLGGFDPAMPADHLAPSSPAVDHRARVDALTAELSRLPGWKRTRILTGQIIDVRARLIRQHIDDVVHHLRRREQTKSAILQIGGEARRVHLELGSRLCQQGLLGDSDDVHLLTTAELAACFGGTSPLGPDALRRRRRWLDRYEQEGVLPLRFSGPPERVTVAAPDGDRLHGWAASPGLGRGRGRVVMAPTDEFATGDILVAQATDASWSPLFLRAAGVVVERGGPLSHAAILARELGLPAVLNVPGACQVLEGHNVSVDGTAGVVVIEPGSEGTR